MPRALSQYLETIAALQSFCIFGYQTDDPLSAVAQSDYFVSCASRLMVNDLILVCADAEREPAWGLFVISCVGESDVTLQNVAGLTPDTINGLTFLRSPLPVEAASPRKGNAETRKATRNRRKAA